MILAGGSGRRLGLVDKPGLLLDGRRLVDIALAAVSPALTVVVGPDRGLPAGTLHTREDPVGGGPAAALVAGLMTLSKHPGAGPGATGLVAVLAADLPGIDSTAVGALVDAVIRQGIDGAVLSDPGGRPQYLAGVWRWQVLLRATAVRPSWHNGRLSDLLGPLIGATVAADDRTSADVDHPADLIRWGLTTGGSEPPDGGS